VPLVTETRTVDGGDLEGLVEAGPNRDVLAYLAEHRPSCHSDTGSALMEAAEKCGDWTAFSPSFGQCLYVALITRGRIFALGLDQRSACFRLPGALRDTALATGATPALEIGADWVAFSLYEAGRPAPDLPFWTLRAYAAAREPDPVEDASHLYEVERRVRYGERPGFRITELQISPTQAVPWHAHNQVQETFYVVEGRVRLFLRDPAEEVSLGPGETFSIGARRPHRVANAGETVATFLVIQRGAYDYIPLASP
jgi:mannose-6-phosphate isomerase-like protein (cupin superfamily)